MYSVKNTCRKLRLVELAVVCRREIEPKNRGGEEAPEKECAKGRKVLFQCTSRVVVLGRAELSFVIVHVPKHSSLLRYHRFRPRPRLLGEILIVSL